MNFLIFEGGIIVLFIISEIGNIQTVKKSFFQVLKWYAEKVKDEIISEQVFGFKMTLIYKITVVNDNGNVIKEFYITNKAD